MNPIYIRRRRFDIIVKFLCLGAAIFGGIVASYFL